MVQKHAQFKDAYEAGTGVSLDGDAEVFLDANKVLSDTFAARLTGKLSKTEEDIDELTNKRGYLGLATRWSPSDTTTVDFLASYQKDLSLISPAGIPYALTGQGDDEDLRDLYIGDPAIDSSDRRMSNIGYELHHEFDNGWALDQDCPLPEVRLGLCRLLRRWLRGPVDSESWCDLPKRRHLDSEPRHAVLRARWRPAPSTTSCSSDPDLRKYDDNTTTV